MIRLLYHCLLNINLRTIIYLTDGFNDPKHQQNLNLTHLSPTVHTILTSIKDIFSNTENTDSVDHVTTEPQW